MLSRTSNNAHNAAPRTLAAVSRARPLSCCSFLINFLARSADVAAFPQWSHLEASGVVLPVRLRCLGGDEEIGLCKSQASRASLQSQLSSEEITDVLCRQKQQNTLFLSSLFTITPPKSITDMNKALF